MFHDLIGPLLALAGTVLVVLMGYHQWKKQQRSSRTAGFVAQRDKTYADLWQKVEAVHLAVRMDRFNPKKFKDLVQAVNIYAIEYALYLDQDVQQQINSYLAALGEFGRLLESAGATEAREKASETSEMPADVLEKVQGLAQAAASVEQHRNALIVRFKKALSATA